MKPPLLPTNGTVTFATVQKAVRPKLLSRSSATSCCGLPHVSAEMLRLASTSRRFDGLPLRGNKPTEPSRRREELSISDDLGFYFSAGGVNRVPGLSIRANSMSM